MAIKTTAVKSAARPTVKTTAKTTSKTAAAKKSVSTNSSQSNANKAIKSAVTNVQKAVKATTAVPVQNKTSQSARRDTFTQTSVAQKTGIYSAPVQYKSVPNCTLIPLLGIVDTIKKYGANLINQTGTASAAKPNAANSRLNNISPKVMYCQTAGWWGNEDTGKKRCSCTAIATTASVNLGVTVKPNQVAKDCTSITADSLQMSRIRMDKNGTQKNIVQDYYDHYQEKGFRYYQFSKPEEVIEVVNNELANDRCVVVKTTYVGEHWVTVTGTVNGQKATQFSDYMGIDPWYNGTGNNDVFYNNDPQYNGIFNLYQNSNQTLHGDYAVMTISKGR